jgi:molecular chaperone HtpG
MQQVKAFIGKKLLDMLMFSMYPDAKIIYREYVQNAFDSIRKAVENGVLSKIKDGIVTITIDPHSRNIVIKDNGTGIPTGTALSVLTSIADSQKDGFEQAGVYGIGRLVGAGYCQQLVFKTSVVGENVASVISFDVEKTRKILDDNNDRSSAANVIDNVVSYHTVEENANEHYFEVTLHNVKEDYPILLSEDDIIEYLQEVAPIDYEMPFKNNIIYDSIQENSEFDSLQKNLGYVKLSVNNHLDIRKRYGNTIVGTGDEIIGLEYFTLDDQNYGRLAWGWFAITKFTKAIPASDKNRGIRLRKLNIQVGEDNYLNKFFDEARGNNYFYGEIHAVHKNLKPNTSRDGLTPTIEATCLFQKLNEYFKQLKFLYNLANKAKNAARDITSANTKINQGGITEEEKNEAKQTLNTGKKRLESANKSVETQQPKQGTAAQKILEQYKKDITESTTQVANEPTEKPKESDNQNNTDQTKIQDIGTSSVPATDVLKQGIPTKQDKVTPSQPQDIMHNLVEKYPKETVWVIRRIFKSLSDNCPKSQVDLIEDLKRLVIKDLEK